MVGKQKPGTNGKADRSVLRLERADHREGAHKEPERAEDCAHICHLMVPLSNGSRLSCGRNARGRKAVERQIKRLASEATQFFPPERPPASSAC